MIYPYSKAYEPYVLYSELLINLEISVLVTPNGSGLVGRRISHDGKTWEILNNFTEALSKCDIVWFVNDEKFKLSEETIKRKVCEAVSRGKRIIFTRTDSLNREKISNIIPTQQKIELEKSQRMEDKLQAEYCYHIDTPILTVYGTEAGTDKLAVQMSLRREFIHRGYRVASISSRIDSELYGMYAMPEFMIGHGCSEAEKIRRYNHYAKQIEITEHPDIMIVGVPGGTLPYDRIDHNEYGIVAYEMSFAVPCDGAVMCMPYNPSFEGDFSDFAHDMELVFRYKTICCHVAAAMPDMKTTMENRKRHLVCLEGEIIDKKIEQYNRRNVFNILSKKGAERAVQLICDVLSEDDESSEEDRI